MNDNVKAILNREEEIKYANILDDGRINLSIIKRGKNDERILYPKLFLEKIFLSVKSFEDLDLLKKIKNIPMKLKDESIFRYDLENINKFINNYEQFNKEDLLKLFPKLNFIGVEPLSHSDFVYQVELLEKYIEAKNKYFNGYFDLIPWYFYNCLSKLSKYSEDLIQEGCLGLIKAINKYDVNRNCSFSNYAIWWIKSQIYSSYSRYNDLSLSTSMIKDIKKYNDFVYKFYNLNNSYPTDEYVASQTGLSESSIKIASSKNYYISSIDTGVKNGRHVAASLTSNEFDEDRIVLKISISKDMRAFSNYLSEREIYVLYKTYGIYDGVLYKLEEIAKELGITHQAVCQIKSRALKKIYQRVKNKY